MPMSSPHPCKGCRVALTRDSLCPECATKQNKRYYEKRRAGLAPSGTYYASAAWRRLRAQHLQLQPLCQEHLRRGAVVVATVVHHVVPREDGGLDAHSNLESLCVACHDAVELRGAVKRQANEHG